MGTFRLFADNSGLSRIETIELEPSHEWTKGLPVTNIKFTTSMPGFMDWHTAPRRQFIIILSGQLEIGVGDGTKHRFGPGDCRLVEDTIGKGHTTEVVGNAPCVMATVVLADQ